MLENLRFGPYLEIVLFVVGGLFLVFSLLLVGYLLLSRKRSRNYAKVLEQETEIFDAITATANMTSANSSCMAYVESSEADYVRTNLQGRIDREGGTTALQTAQKDDTDPMDDIPLSEGIFDPSVIAGAYTITREIGGGAMSRTFEIRSNKLGNPWFLKFVSSKDGRLANEEHILKLLNHPSLPKIADVFYRDEGTYLIETLVEGVPLNMLGETKMKLSQYILLDWFEQMAQALNYLHNIRPQPVYHLDLKPGNIIITHDNRLVLVDFGISRHLGEGRSGAMTATYAAPEQFGGRVPQKYTGLFNKRFGKLPPDWGNWAIDARTDIYSLGVILFELATGQAPTHENTHILDQNVSHELATIIRRCIDTQPNNRYHDAEELLNALRHAKGSKIRMARTLLLRRIAKVAAAITIVATVSLLGSGSYVYALEGGATLYAEPEVVTVSLHQSTAFNVERTLRDGRNIQMDAGEITWVTTGDDIARIDGGRITGMNLGDTYITGRHRHHDISLHIRVVEPMDGMIEISQRFQEGRTLSHFAGSDLRTRIDGNIADMDFFSPESITAAADGTLYIADAGALRRISGGVSTTVELDLTYISVDMVRSFRNEVFIRSAPWINEDEQHVHALAHISGGGRVEKLFISDATHTAIEDFAFSSDGQLYFILRNAGLGSVFLYSLNPQAPDVPIVHSELPEGSTSLAVGSDGVVYIGNTSSGVIIAYTADGLRSFAGLGGDRGFIDGTDPRFYMPQRLGYQSGYLYVWDFNTLRRVSVDSGESISLAGFASPVYDNLPGHLEVHAEDAVLPHGRLMDFVVADDGVYISDHKRSIVWRLDY